MGLPRSAGDFVTEDSLDAHSLTDARKPPFVEIGEVRFAHRGDEVLPGYALDAPRPGARTGTYAFPFEGWIVPERAAPVRLDITRNGLPVDSVPVGIPRPDVASLLPDFPWAEKCGFHSEISVLCLPPEFEVDATVFLEDGTSVPFAVLSGRTAAPASEHSGPEPLVVTSLGRSGSTWVIKLLSGHPEIAAYPPYVNEIRVVAYWTEILLALGSPASYRESVASLIEDDHWWIGQPDRLDDYYEQDVRSWLGREQVGALMDFCRGRIEAFYDRFVPANGVGPPRFFVEKRLPSPRCQIFALRRMFPGTREVFLVRDFRDMLASMLAYNAKRGHPYFGRGIVSSDEEFVREHLGEGVKALAQAWLERADSGFLLRYEDLVMRPREVLGRLLRFLGLEENDERIDELLLKVDRDRSSVELAHRTTESAEQSVGRWRKELSPALVTACEEMFGDTLRLFGYSV
jgi:hypothetical protein